MMKVTKHASAPQLLFPLFLAALLLGLGRGAWAAAGRAAALDTAACDVVVGPGEAFTAIQPAVDSAAAGQTVCVRGGSYHEVVTIPVAKTGLALVAYPGETPIIDGQKLLPGGAVDDRFKSLVDIKAANVVFDGFEVRFSSARGLDVAAGGVIVRNSAVHDNWSTGINISAGTALHDVLIENNRVYNNMRRSQHAPVVYKGARSGSGAADWTFDPDVHWDTPFWSGADADLPEQWLNGVSMTFNDDGHTDRVYVGSARAGRVGYIGAEYSASGSQFDYSGADILFHEPSTNKWTLYFDGEPLGITASNDEVIDAFQIESTEPISEPWECPACAPMLLSFTETVTLPLDEGGVVTNTAIGRSDLVYFRPTGLDSFNRITGGYFTLYKRAADLVGLPPEANIDALDRAPDGRLLISLTATHVLTNPDSSTVAVEREDLVAYDEATGYWALFFEGDQVLYNPFQAEDLTAAWVDDDGHIYISGDPIGGAALTFINAADGAARGNHVYNNYGEGLVADRGSVAITLEENVLYDNQHASLYLNSTVDSLVRGNLVFCTDDRRFWRKGSTRYYRPGPGIQLRDESFDGTNSLRSSGQIIINNIVVGCSTNFGVSTQVTGGGLNDALVANNTFVNARGDHVSGVFNVELNNNASYAGSQFVNNLILQNTPGAIVSGAGISGLTVANNLYSATPPTSWFDGEPGRVVGNPRLVGGDPPLPVMSAPPDPADYRLTYDSPALDAGQSPSQVLVDYFNQSRAAAGPFDIGAHELPHIGRIIVFQETAPAAYTQTFDFSAAFLPGGFSLQGGQSYTSDTLEAGVYSVASGPVEGWTTTAACSDGSPASAIQLGPNETVTCTFSSTRQTRLTVFNVVEPAGDPQLFTFNLSPGNGFDLAEGSYTAVVEPGVAHMLSADTPTGWQQTDASCSNGDAPGAVTLEPGEWVACTFTHRKLGRVVIEKQTLPDGAAQVFDFAGDFGAFALSDGQQHTSDYRPPGTYSVTEAATAGWVPASATCDDGSSPAAIALSSGETVTCVFINARLALGLSLTPTPGAVTSPGGEVVFAVRVVNEGGAGVMLVGLTDSVYGDVADAGNAALLDTTCVLPQDLSPGVAYECAFTATVSGASGETRRNTLTAAGTGPNDTPVTTAVEAAVTIDAPPTGRIIVVKQTDPPHTPGSFSFTTDYGTGSFVLSHGQSHDSGPLPSGVTYRVSESDAPGWQLVGATCDDGSPPAAVALAAGETVTCTFINSPTTTGPLATFYVSTTKAGTVRGLSYAPGDILAYNSLTDVWSLYFDASNVGLLKPLGDFVLLDDGSILLTVNGRVKLRNAAGALFTLEIQDIARFVPSSLGPATAGTFEFYFDGSDVGLTTSGEKIDTLARRPDGTLLIGTSGAASVKNGGSTVKAADEDLLAFAPAALGEATSGSWSLAFDGSTLSGMAVENLTAAWHDAATGDLYLTVTSNFTIGGVGGTNRTVLRVTPAGAVSVHWNAADAGFPALIDGLHVQKIN